LARRGFPRSSGSWVQRHLALGSRWAGVSFGVSYGVSREREVGGMMTPCYFSNYRPVTRKAVLPILELSRKITIERTDRRNV